MKLGWLFGAMILGAFATPAAGAGLDGDEVRVDLVTQFAGGFGDPTAVVGPGVEFTRVFTPTEVQLSVDLSGIGITIRYENDFNGFVNIGLVGFQFSDLDLEGGEVIDHVALFSSGFPQDFFSITNGQRAFSIGVSDINLQMPPSTVYTATFAIVAPEAAPAAGLLASVSALTALSARRAARNAPLSRR